MNKKQILVITPTLGNRDSLKRTINSVREIGGDDVRHVLVCPVNRIAAIEAVYGDVECLAEPVGNKGIYGAVNYGFLQYGHQYPYLTYINDDDYWMPAYRKIIDSVKKNPELDLVYGRVYYTNECNEIIGKQTCSGRFKDFVPLLSYGITLMTQQASLLRSSLFFDCGGYDEKYKIVADTKLWAQLSRMPIKYKYVNAYCATYMRQEGQLPGDEDLKNREHDVLKVEIGDVNNRNKALWLFRFKNLFLYIERMVILGHVSQKK